MEKTHRNPPSSLLDVIRFLPIVSSSTAQLLITDNNIITCERGPITRPAPFACRQTADRQRRILHRHRRLLARALSHRRSTSSTAGVVVSAGVGRTRLWTTGGPSAADAVPQPLRSWADGVSCAVPSDRTGRNTVRTPRTETVYHPCASDSVWSARPTAQNSIRTPTTCTGTVFRLWTRVKHVDLI